MGPILFNLFFNDLPLHVKDISVDCDMLADDTTLHTSGKDIMQIRGNMQDSLDQVSDAIGVTIIIWSSLYDSFTGYVLLRFIQVIFILLPL